MGRGGLVQCNHIVWISKKKEFKELLRHRGVLRQQKEPAGPSVRRVVKESLKWTSREKMELKICLSVPFLLFWKKESRMMLKLLFWETD